MMIYLKVSISDFLTLFRWVPHVCFSAREPQPFMLFFACIRLLVFACGNSADCTSYENARLLFPQLVAGDGGAAARLCARLFSGVKNRA